MATLTFAWHPVEIQNGRHNVERARTTHHKYFICVIRTCVKWEELFLIIAYHLVQLHWVLCFVKRFAETEFLAVTKLKNERQWPSNSSQIWPARSTRNDNNLYQLGSRLITRYLSTRINLVRLEKLLQLILGFVSLLLRRIILNNTHFICCCASEPIRQEI